MLTIAYRRTEQIPLYQAIESHVVKFHGTKEWESVKAHIKTLHNLREEIAGLQSVDDSILLQKYQKMCLDYFKGMRFLQQKFKFNDEDDGINLSWVWYDSLTGEKKHTVRDLDFELSSILYNLGAIINNYGTHTPIEGDAVKTVSQKFQEAAWIFNYLKDFTKNLQPSVRSHDFSIENLTFLSTLQLSQSQYCFYKKASGAKMSDDVMAKITKQLSVFFEDTEKAAQSSNILVKSPNMTTISFYRYYYSGLAHYHKGLAQAKIAEEDGESMGLAAGFIQQGLTFMATASSKSTSGTKSACQTRTKEMTEAFKDLKMKAEKIYYKEVAGEKEVKATPIEAKNFTMFRSIESELACEGYEHKEAFAVFQPMQVRQLESELMTKANELINKNID